MGQLTVRFLGSGDAFGSGGRFNTCIFARTSGFGFLIDCGASSLIAMRRFEVDPNAIDAILLTHLHGDHFGGLPFFLLDAQLISRRTKPLIVAGPPGVHARVTAAREVFFPKSSTTTLKFDATFVELPERVERAIGPLQVTPYPVVHFSGAPSYALRVACAGKTIAYSGDTEWTGVLCEVAADADLFICEAYFFEKHMKFHLDYRTLVAHRPELTCKRLILTHMNQDMLSRLDEVDAETADDGLEIDLS